MCSRGSYIRIFVQVNQEQPTIYTIWKNCQWRHEPGMLLAVSLNFVMKKIVFHQQAYIQLLSFCRTVGENHPQGDEETSRQILQI